MIETDVNPLDLMQVETLSQTTPNSNTDHRDRK